MPDNTPQLPSLLYNTSIPNSGVASPMEYVNNDIKVKAKQTSFSPNYMNLMGSEQYNSLDALKDDRIKLKDYSANLEDVYAETSGGELISRYKDFIVGTNNEERLAQAQTTTEKWVNGFEKLVGKTGVAVLGGTLGVVDSLVEGIAKGSLSEAYNTGFNRWLDDLNTQLDYKLPNYYTEQEKSAGLFEQTTQANFWADKVFGGLSFTAGALISEGIWTAATGGVGLLSAESQLGRLAKWTVKGVGGEEKAVAAMNAAKKMAKGSADTLLETTAKNSKSIAKEIGVGDNLATEIASATKDASINAYKIRKIADVALVATRSAGYEAGMEARQYMNSTEHAWLENYQKVNGHEPSADEYAQFKDGLTTSANMVFGANMIIVGTSNIAQFGNALLGKTTNPLVGNNFLKRSLLGIGFDKTITEEGKIVYKALEATRGQKIAGKVWGVLGAALPEAQEEMGQRVVSQTAENYMLKAFDSKNTKTTYGIADAFTESLNNTYGTQEGWTEGMIGAIVGVLGAGAHSRFKFGEVTAEREDVARNVEYANQFTAENHMNNVIANNKIIAAQESKEQAQQRGDLVGEVLADSASAIHYIDRNLAIGNEHEGLADFTRQVNAVSNEDLALDLGLGSGEEAEEQAANFKEQKIAEFKNISDKHTKNLNYAQALLGETQIAGLDKISTREVVRAMAYSMTMGEVAMKTNQDLVSHVRNLVAESVNVQGASDAMDVQQVLDLAPKEKTLKLSQLNLQLFNLNKKEKEVLNKQFEASKVSESSLATPEDSKARQNALIDINKELLEVQEEKNNISQQKQLALDAIGIRNYTDADITVDMFDQQNENLDKLRTTLADIKLTDPEKYFEIQKALQAQSKAVQHIKNYQRTSQAIVNPNTRVKVLNGWITNLLNKNTKLNEGTAAYFTDVLENWQKETVVVFQESQNLKERRAFQNGEAVSEDYKQQLGKEVRDGQQLNSIDQEIYNAYQKEIEDNAKATIEDGTPTVAPKVELTSLQQLKNKVTEIITSNDYLTQYFGADLAEQNKTKPSEDDVRAYEDLLAKIDRKIEPNIDKIVSRPTGFYKNLGLTDEEVDDLKRLQTKLNDWLTLEGTVTNDSQSVAEMLDLIDALQTQAVKTTVKTDLQDKDYTTVVDAVDEQANSVGSSVRGLKTPTTALATKSKTNIRFSHIRVETLASFFPNSNLIVNSNKTFEIALNNGQTLSGKINQQGGQDIPLKEWNKVASQSTVLIKNFGTNSSAISQFLGLDSQGNELYQNVPSDFDYQQTDGSNLTVDQVAVNQVKNGDILDLFVSSTDSYNASLSNKDLPNFIHIYVMKNGKLLGSLPAPYTKEDGEIKESVEGISMQLADLRKSAAEFTKGKEGLIKLPQKMTAQIVFIGAPQITLQKSGEDVVTKNNPFTKEMLQNIVGQGYIENGNIVSTIKTDVNQFINKISNSNKDVKIPFVTFNYNSKVVAFPISLNSFTVDKSEAVLEVFNSAEATTAVKAKTLVDALIANGLEASSYGIDFTDKEGWIDSQETENALKDLSQIKEFVDLERFATKNYNKENLTNDATIAINLADIPFETSKIMLGMSNKIDSDVLGYREFLAENEEKEKQLRTDLNEVAKEVYSKYINNEDLDNTFTQTFDETPIIKDSNSDIVMRQNINTLKTALKRASQKTKKVIGADLFKRANDLIKALNSTTKKSKDVKQQIKDSEYYQDVDTTFVTVDNEGNLENPYINETEAIQEIGGIKTEEEFNNALENSSLDYLKTQAYSSKNLPKITKNFTVVEVRDFTEYGQNIFTPQQQLKFNQGQNYEPVRIIADPQIIELISIGAKVNNLFSGKPQNINKIRQKELEKILSMSASDANTKAKELARKNRSSSTERFIILGNIETTTEKQGSQLFEDMSQFNNIPVKEIIGGELVDKLNTEVKDTLEATLREPENNALAQSLANLEGYSESVWSSSPEAVKTLLKDIEKQVLTINVDLRGLADTYDTKSQAEILNVTRALDEMIKNPTETTLENFINVYQDFTNVVQEIERAVVKVDERYRNEPLIKLETQDSEYKTFKEQGLLKIQENIYIKTDGHEKSLAEVESLSATNTENFPAGTIQGDVKNTELVKEDLNTYVETQMADVLTNDAEYDVDTVKKLIYYKTYFGTQGVKAVEKSYENQLSQIVISDIKNRDYLTSEYIAEIRNKQLKGENTVLDNLVFNQDGITLKYTDQISVNQMNEYLKEDEDLRNYFLLSKNTNFEVTGVAQNELVSERDLMVNGATKENYKGDYRTINSETLQLKSNEDFITISGENYERIESDFYAKLPLNQTNFLEVGAEKPLLNIDISDYSSIQSEAEVSTNNKYSAEESKKIDDSLACD